MHIVVWLVVGALVGWIASLIMRTDAQQGVALDAVVGTVGALIAGWIVAPAAGVAPIKEGNFSSASILVYLLGAIILQALVNLLRRGRAR